MSGRVVLAAPPEARPSAVGVWWAAIRPATLWAGAVPVGVGTAIAAAEGNARADVALAALAGALLIQIGTNLFNDAADFEKGADTAERVGPARAVQRGWLSGTAVRRGAYLALALAFGVGCYLIAVAGWPIAVLGLISLLLAVAYTGGPFPLAYVGLGDLFVLVFFGVGAVCGTVFAHTGAVGPSALLASLAVGLLATGILVVNNLRDRHTDVAANKRTLAVRFGATAARAEYALCVLGSYGLVAAVWLAGWGGPGWLLPLISLPMAGWLVRAVLREDGADLNPRLGGTAKLQLVFGALLCAGVLL